VTEGQQVVLCCAHIVVFRYGERNVRRSTVLPKDQLERPEIEGNITLIYVLG